MLRNSPADDAKPAQIRLSARFWRFGMVGAIGFVVDTAVLYLVRDWLGPYAGRLLSFSVAVVTTWLVNRTLTFADRKGQAPLWREFVAYFAAMSAGGVVNLVAYWLLVAFVALVAEVPALGVAAGSLAGLTVNFALAHRFVFKAIR